MFEVAFRNSLKYLNLLRAKRSAKAKRKDSEAVPAFRLAKASALAQAFEY